MIEHRRIRVYGIVQGVSFRASAQAEARRLGRTGFAANEPDGSVAIEVEGAPEALGRFVGWCRRGPVHARVERLDISPAPPAGFDRFDVR